MPGYLAFARRWIAECVRVLKLDGSLFCAIGDEFAAEHKVRIDEAGLFFRNWIIWHYRFGPHQQKKFGRDHAHILYYVSHPEVFTFNPDAVKVPSVRQLTGDKRAKAGGRVPGDVWQFESNEVWSVPRLPGNAKERTGHPCQMPESILERIILATTNPDALIVDPFCGSGTTVAVAKRLGRRVLSCDLSEDYARRAAERCGITYEVFNATSEHAAEVSAEPNQENSGAVGISSGNSTFVERVSRHGSEVRREDREGEAG